MGRLKRCSSSPETWCLCSLQRNSSSGENKARFLPQACFNLYKKNNFCFGFA